MQAVGLSAPDIAANAKFESFAGLFDGVLSAPEIARLRAKSLVFNAYALSSPTRVSAYPGGSRGSCVVADTIANKGRFSSL